MTSWGSVAASWTGFAGAVVLGWYYYNHNGKPKRVGRQQANGEITRRQSIASVLPEAIANVIIPESKNKKKKAKKSKSQNTGATSDSATSDAPVAPVHVEKPTDSGLQQRKKGKDKNMNKNLQSGAQSSAVDAPVQAKTREKESDTDNKAFAALMQNARAGTQFSSGKTEKSQVRTQKPSKLKSGFDADSSASSSFSATSSNVGDNEHITSGTSSTTGRDANDDLSPVQSPTIPAAANQVADAISSAANSSTTRSVKETASKLATDANQAVSSVASSINAKGVKDAAAELAKNAASGISAAADSARTAVSNSSVANSTGVADMLEPAAPGPSTLRITESLTPVTNREKKTKAPEVVESKKQRAARRKREAEKEAREELEKQRKAAEEKQRRTAREARGESAKNGNGWTYNSGTPAKSWSAGKTNGTVPATTSLSGALLDTTEDANNSLPTIIDNAAPLTNGAGNNASTAKNIVKPSTNGHWSNTLPSEEEQLRLIQEDNDWTTIPESKKAKRKTVESSTANGSVTAIGGSKNAYGAMNEVDV